MKKLLILLALFPLLAYAQRPTTNLDFLFKDSIANVGGKFYLVDSITGVHSTNYELYLYKGTTDSNYIQCNRGGYLIIYADTLSLSTMNEYKADYNNADTTYFLLQRQEINSDSTEIYPKRISEIAHHSAATTDPGNYYGALYPSSPYEVGTGKTYSTIQLAITAASTGDTVTIFDVLNSGVNNSKNLVFIGVGNSRIYTETYYGISSSQSCTIIGIDIVSTTNVAARMGTTSGGDLTIKDCSLDGTISAYSSYDANDSLLLYDSDIKAYVSWKGSNAILKRNYSGSRDYHVRPFTNVQSYYNYFDTCTLASMWVGSNVNFNLYSYGDTYIGNGYYSGSVTDTVNSHFKKCYFNPITYEFDERVTGGTHYGSIIYDSCTFYRDVFGNYGGRMYNEGNLTFTNNNIQNWRGNFIFYENTEGYHTADFENNNIDIDSNNSIYLSNINIDVANDTLNNVSYVFVSDDSVRNCHIDNIIYSYDNDTLGKIRIENYKPIIENSSFILDDYFEFEMFNQIVNDDSLVFKNNYLEYHYTGTEGFLLVMSSAYDYRFKKGCFLSGNHFKLPRLWGNENNIHFFSNVRVSLYFDKNFIEGTTLGLVNKNYENYDSIYFEVTGNLFKNCLEPIICRAMDGTLIYNNTVINTDYTLYAALSVDDNEVPPQIASDSGKFYNNIVYSTQGGNAVDFSDSSLYGWEINNNVYYGVNFKTDTGGVVNFATWQGYGYDANSYNTDPLLDSNGVPQAGSDAIDNGKYLGPPYNEALVVGSTWPDNLTTVTVPSGFTDIGPWDVESSRAVISNLKIIRSGNLLIRINK